MIPNNRALYKQGGNEMYFLLSPAAPDKQVLDWCFVLFGEKQPFVLDPIEIGIRNRAIERGLEMGVGACIDITDSKETREYRYDGYRWMLLCTKDGGNVQINELEEHEN